MLSFGPSRNGRIVRDEDVVPEYDLATSRALRSPEQQDTLPPTSTSLTVVEPSRGLTAFLTSRLLENDLIGIHARKAHELKLKGSFRPSIDHYEVAATLAEKEGHFDCARTFYTNARVLAMRVGDHTLIDFYSTQLTMASIREERFAKNYTADSTAKVARIFRRMNNRELFSISRREVYGTSKD